MPPRARTNLLRLLAPCVVLVVGCSGPPPNSVSSNVSNGPDDRFATRILTPADSKRVLEIMRESVNGPTDDPARPAAYGVRWSDVRLAASRAGRGLELAILSVTELDDAKTKQITMVSIGDIPVELVVRRLPPPKIYEATATAGLFEEQQKLASDLVARFNESMKLYGAKPSWPALANE